MTDIDSNVQLGAFIDAAVQNQTLARELLANAPHLKNLRWIHKETALHFLAVEGYVDAVRLLIELGFDVDATNEFGDPPLLDVVCLGNAEIAEALLQAGAKTDIVSVRGTLLECAEFNDDTKMKDLLLKYAARIKMG